LALFQQHIPVSTEQQYFVCKIFSSHISVKIEVSWAVYAMSTNVLEKHCHTILRLKQPKRYVPWKTW